MPNWNLKKKFRVTMNLNQLYGSPPDVMYTLNYGESLYTDAHKHTLHNLLLTGFYKNRYGNVNLDLQSAKSQQIYHLN